jgi:hypothetical protein
MGWFEALFSTSEAKHMLGLDIPVHLPYGYTLTTGQILSNTPRIMMAGFAEAVESMANFAQFLKQPTKPFEDLGKKAIDYTAQKGKELIETVGKTGKELIQSATDVSKIIPTDITKAFPTGITKITTEMPKIELPQFQIPSMPTIITIPSMPSLPSPTSSNVVALGLVGIGIGLIALALVM